MNTLSPENIVSIRQQITRLESDYMLAHQQGKQFEVLKKIRLQIRDLEAGFRKMDN